MLELDDHQPVGFVRAIEGGGVRTEIAPVCTGGAHLATHQLGLPRFEDVVVHVGLSMSRGFYDWIAAFVAGRGRAKNGAIVAADFHYRERFRRELHDAVIAEVTVPQLDAADRSPCAMRVTLAPSRISFASGRGVPLPPVPGQRHKLWTANRFELCLDGLEAATRRTLKVEAFTIKRPAIEYRCGARLDPVRVPGRLEYPSLSFHIPEADAGPIFAELSTRMLGRNARRDRRTGHLWLLASDGSRLCEISLEGVQVASIGPDRSDATSQDIKQLKVEISIDAMAFAYRSDAVDA